MSSENNLEFVTSQKLTPILVSITGFFYMGVSYKKSLVTVARPSIVTTSDHLESAHTTHTQTHF
jgi:hypothetical protein